MFTPQRMCVSCKNRNCKTNLIRIAKNSKNEAVVDFNKNLDGRAIYVCKNEKCIDLLKKSKAIQRFLNADYSDNFYDELKNIK